MPLDLLVYHTDSLILPAGYRVTEDDEYYEGVRRQWPPGCTRCWRTAGATGGIQRLRLDSQAARKSGRMIRPYRLWAPVG